MAPLGPSVDAIRHGPRGRVVPKQVHSRKLAFNATIPLQLQGCLNLRGSIGGLPVLAWSAPGSKGVPRLQWKENKHPAHFRISERMEASRALDSQRSL